MKYQHLQELGNSKVFGGFLSSCKPIQAEKYLLIILIDF